MVSKNPPEPGELRIVEPPEIKMEPPYLRVDYLEDRAYMHLREGTILYAGDIGDGINVDYTAGKKIVGIEFLGGPAMELFENLMEQMNRED